MKKLYKIQRQLKRQLNSDKVAAILIGVILLIKSQSVFAQLEININQGILAPTPIAITLPKVDNGLTNLSKLSLEVTSIIENNLKTSGFFKLTNNEAFLEDKIGIDNLPDFEAWQASETQILLASYLEKKNDKYTLSFRIWDIFTRKQLSKKTLTSSSIRKIAHVTSDEIYEKITGDTGYFDTKIVYIAETKGGKKPIKRLALMDQDGKNHQYLTNGDYTVLTPRFSSTLKQILYLSYQNGVPQVFIYDLVSGKQLVLGKFPGMTFAPRFSHDGKDVAFAFARNGNSEVYTMNLSNGKFRKITFNPAIDISPSFSPDGKRLTFNSDRSGSPQIYVLNLNQPNKVSRISYGDGRYFTPVWSPRGDLIAFTKQRGGKFAIGVMKPDGSSERILSESYHDEAPSWSPNGRRIIFFRATPYGANKKRSTGIYSVDVTGYFLHRIKTLGNASDPSWSPLIGN